MLRIIATALSLALLPAMASAADLTGAWVRDNAHSDTVPSSMYWLTRGVDAGGTRGPEGQAVVIELEQTATGLKVRDPARPERNYVLDGAARTVPADTGGTEASVTATKVGDAVVVRTRQPYAGLPGNVEVTVEETWTPAADGQSVTLTTVRETPARRHTYTETFKRQ
jgi:hypothetical protein